MNFVQSYAQLVVTIFVGILAAIAIPSLMAGRQTATEVATIGNLRQLEKAEETAHNLKGRYLLLEELASKHLLDSGWENGAVRMNGRFREVGEFDEATFEFAAKPVSSVVGERLFNVIEDLVIRQSPGMTAPTRDTGDPLD